MILKNIILKVLFINIHPLFHFKIVLVVINFIVIQKMDSINHVYLLIFLFQKNLKFYFMHENNSHLKSITITNDQIILVIVVYFQE